MARSKPIGKWLTKADMAEAAGVAVETIAQWIARDKATARRTGEVARRIPVPDQTGRLLWDGDRREVQEWVKAKTAARNARAAV